MRRERGMVLFMLIGLGGISYVMCALLLGIRPGDLKAITDTQ